MRLAAALALAAVLAGCSTLDPTARSQSWQRGAVDVPDRNAWREEKVAWPAFPREENLREFHPGPLGRHRYFVDLESVRIDKDGVARYTVVVQASGGARSVSFEGIRCETREKRAYAFGHGAGRWVAARQSGWEPIRFRMANEYQEALYEAYFCPEGRIVRDTAAARRNVAELSGDPRAAAHPD